MALYYFFSKFKNSIEGDRGNIECEKSKFQYISFQAVTFKSEYKGSNRGGCPQEINELT